MRTSEKIDLISKALVPAQRAMAAAVKDSENPFFKSSYASLNAVIKASRPVLNEHGISVLQPVIRIQGDPYVETVLLHESGQWIAGEYPIEAKTPNDPQTFKAAVTYARRSALLATVCLEDEDDDGNTASGVNEPKEPEVNKPAKTTTAKAAAPKGECEHNWAPNKFKPGTEWCTKCKAKR